MLKIACTLSKDNFRQVLLPVFKERKQVGILFLAVNGHACYTTAYARRVGNTDLVGRLPEFTGDFKLLPLPGNAGIYPQPVIVGLNAQDILADGVEIPGSSSREPAVLGFPGFEGVPSGDHLGVDVGFGTVEVADFLKV